MKLLKSNILTLCLGILLGAGGVWFLSSNNTQSNYYQLNEDYCIDDVGHLKKGTIVKIDEGMSEGFTRYLLYLNLNDAEDVVEYETDNYGQIIPYWLNPYDSLCSN